ncbi:ATP-binding cassette domain-containing protein [Spiroplasma poulsonii]|nr:ATP-binding cassette domain-containing protein [Spiroplasma poulsonii]
MNNANKFVFFNIKIKKHFIFHKMLHLVYNLQDINLEIKESESVAFLGANGSGKTTLVEIISGVLKPSTGKVMFVNDKYEKIRLLALLVKKLQIFVKKILIEKYNFN